MTHILTLDSMKNLSVDEIVRLYQLGYRIEDLAIDPVVNFGKVTVSTGYTSSAFSIVLNTGDGARLPLSGAFNLVWYNSTDYSDPSDDPNREIVRVTGIYGDTLTVDRGQEGTLASNKNTPGKTYKMILAPTAKMIPDIQTDAQSRVDTHSTLTSGIHGAGSNYLAIASGSQYTAVNKAGDTMLGTFNLPLNGLTVGTDQLVVSGENVGIGTTTPIIKLHVVGTDAAESGTATPNGAIMAGGSGSTAVIDIGTVSSPRHGWIQSRNNDGAVFNNLVLNPSGGNVGIGTTIPTAMLELNGGSIKIFRGGATNAPTYTGDDRATIAYNYVVNYPSAGTYGRILDIVAPTEPIGGPTFIRFFTALTGTDPTERMIIYNNGNIGIGITTPGYNLDVNSLSTTAIMVRGGASNYSILSLFSTGLVQGWSLARDGTDSNKFKIWDTSTSNTRLTIDNTGYVGIGTTSPSGLLTVKNPSTHTQIDFDSSAADRVSNINLLNNGVLKWNFSARGTVDTPNNRLSLYNSVGSEVFTVLQTGNIGIGIGNPTYTLQLVVDSAAKPGTNTWTISSDERIKKDIRPFTDGIQTILNINPVWYKYNGKAGFKEDNIDHIGVIGQEIKDIAPYTINTYKAKLNEDDKDETELLNFNSHALTFVLINAIRELKNKFDDEINNLKDEIKILKTSKNN